jgi:hypothetical protein
MRLHTSSQSTNWNITNNTPLNRHSAKFSANHCVYSRIWYAASLDSSTDQRLRLNDYREPLLLSVGHRCVTDFGALPFPPAGSSIACAWQDGTLER